MTVLWRARTGRLRPTFLTFSSILSKFAEGGYLHFCFSLVQVLMGWVVHWHYVHVLPY
jgi:KUP system potassium uptake protein